GLLIFANAALGEMTPSFAQRPGLAAASRAKPSRLPGSGRRRPMPAFSGAAPCACGGGCPRCGGAAPIQAKLATSAPGDRFEREADRIADHVREKPAHAGVGHAPALMQRTGASSTGRTDAAPASVDNAL